MRIKIEYAFISCLRMYFCVLSTNLARHLVMADNIDLFNTCFMFKF